MKLLTRMMAFLSFLVMVQYANAAGNSVYVDQIGDGSTINITQTGNSNAVGNATNKATFNGGNNLVTVEQIGNTNIANINIQGAGNTISSQVTGDSNSVEISCGAGSGGCSGSTITNTITGDGNAVTQNHDGTTISTVSITSDNNTVNINNTSTAAAGAKSAVDISGGGGNEVAITQAGAAGVNGHDASVTIIGATNTVDVKQGGSVDSKVVSSINGSGNTLTIKSNHQ
jgi:hypothetical protein